VKEGLMAYKEGREKGYLVEITEGNAAEVILLSLEYLTAP
jgi:hypothetical protein